MDTLPTDPPRIMIKTDMLRWISLIKPAANFGLEVAVGPQHRLDLSVGWYLGSSYFAEFREESYRGPRLRMGWKWIRRIDPETFLYAGLEGRYDRITHREWAYALRQGTQYVEILLRNRMIESMGSAVRIGFQMISGKTGRWMFEPEFILGLAQHRVFYHDPDDISLVSNNDGLFDFRYPDGRSTWVYPGFRLNVGYVLVR